MEYFNNVYILNRPLMVQYFAMMRFIQSVVLLSLATAANAADKTWTLGRHIFVFRDEQKTWDAAKKDCESRNMHLAKVDSESITDSIRNNVRYEVWIGAKQIGNNNNEWKWLDGSKMIRRSHGWHDEGNRLVYTNWKTYEPSDPTERCMLVQQQNHKKWNDYSCTSDKVRFLCQETSGIPTMVEALPVKCTSNLTVKFQPSRRTSEYFHNITVFNRDRSRVVTSRFVQAQGEGVQSSTDFKLWPWTTYHVEVTACITNTVCISRYSNSTTAQTQGLPRSVKDIVVSEESDKFSCVITWAYPNHRSKNHLTVYKIHWNETMESVLAGSVIPHNSGSKEINNASATSYNFMGKPNRRYKFGLQAGTCAGFGNLSWSTECVTDSKAPDTVTKPVVSSEIASDGTLNMTINTPNQHNGKISCLLVIVKFRDEMGNVQSTSEYSIEDLKRANSSASEYIAISHPVTDTATQEDFVLGNGKASICSIKTGTGRKTKRELRDDIFVGRNPRLYNNNTYNIFMVSASPTRTGYALKASETVQVSAVDETSNNESGQSQAGITTGIIAGPILGVFVVIFIIIIMVVLQIRRKKLLRNEVKEPQYAEIDDDGRKENDPQPLVQDIVYYSSSEVSAVRKRTNTDIPMKDFENVYNSIQSNGGNKFAEQFNELTRITALTSNLSSKSQLEENAGYDNIRPNNDETKVPIHHNEHGYIDASFINGHEMKRKFIATHNPTKETTHNFWMMIAEQNCTEIVMLGQCQEGGKPICEKYWPDLGDTTAFGEVKVSNLNETPYCGFVCRSLKVSASWKGESTGVMVSQFQFLRWPGHGLPITTSHILQIHEKCMETWKCNGSKSPIVVHCGAGAGRSGTFIEYDILLNESKFVGNADVFECVAKVRRQRMDAAQNCDQYILVHKLLLESHLFGSTDVSGADLFEKFSSTRYKNVVIPEQFKNLSRVKSLDISQKDTSEKLSTYDRMAVKLYERGQDIMKSLEASYVETYDNSFPLLISKEPTKSNLEVFWKLIDTEDVSTIVMITEPENEVFSYWNESCNFPVAVKHEKVVDTTTIRKLYISGKVSTSKAVTHIHLKLYGRRSDSQDIAKINEFVRCVQINLRESKGTALVHCKSGLGMSAVFCTMLNLLDRLKAEDRVDVFRAVKDLRDCKKGLIQTLDQFRLCHEAVVKHRRNFEAYSNL